MGKKKLTTFNEPLNQSSEDKALEQAISLAQEALIKEQHADGHWCFELEADCTIPAEYILMMHFVDEIDDALQHKLAIYLRELQNEEGGWPLFYDGESDISCSVKCYYALKLAGDDIQAPHMQKAKALILKLGGAARANVFTRIMLAQFEQIPWRGVPFMPVELVLAPKWFPFHVTKVSYWSRTVMVPLLVLCSLKIQAANPTKINIPELFTTPPDQEKDYFPIRSNLNRIFIWANHTGRKLEWMIPKWLRNKAVANAMSWTHERINTEHGLGAIFPAMVNAFEALKALNRPEDKEAIEHARNALKKLVTERDDMAYVQPCFSPIWDTALATMALCESTDRVTPEIQYACDWLKAKQLKDHEGDWKHTKHDLEGGGWPFQYENSHYPDLDDTALVAYVLHKNNHSGYYDDTIQRATKWLVGMQSANGGFGSFDVDNTYYYLNEIPFADHGALLDPPSADVSARVAMLLGSLKDVHWHNSLINCLNYLFEEQESNGSWFGRWGTNYVYGTWSVLIALEEIGFRAHQPTMRAAVAWLKNSQNRDGGWGEDNGSYYEPPKGDIPAPSTSFQTAWALIALISAGEAQSIEVKKGIDYLISTQKSNGFWYDPYFTAPGFPRVFYLKYHGYSKYFPLWALAKYRKHTDKGISHDDRGYH